MDLRAQRLAQVRGAEIDQRIGAGAHGSHPPCAGERVPASAMPPERLDQLDRREPDAAAGAGHEHGLARPEPAALDQREMRGLVDEAHRRGLGEAHRVGHDVGVLVLRQDLLGVGAVLDLGQHPVAEPGNGGRPRRAAPTTPAASLPGTNGRGGRIWYLPPITSRSG